MLDWCIDSANETEFGRPFGTMPQVNPTTIANKEYCEKSVHPCKSWQLGHERGWLSQSSAFRRIFYFHIIVGGLKQFGQEEYELITKQKNFYRQTFLSFLNSSIVCCGRHVNKNYFQKKVSNISF